MTDDQRVPGPSRFRLLWAVVAVVGCLPYLVLKACWIAGVPIGWIDRSVVETPGFVAGNIPTLGMDVVVVLLAIVFVARWGQRVPGWLLVFPVWIGTGLLVPIPLTMGVSALLSPVVGAGARVVSNDVLHDWVPVLVYGGFTVQAIGLLTGFVLYARARWPQLFAIRMSERSTGQAGGALVIISAAGALAAVGSTLGLLTLAILSEAADPKRLLIDRTSAVVGTVLVCAGVGATLALTALRTKGHSRFAIPMIISWIGIAVGFAESLFGLMGALISGELTQLMGLPAESLLQLLGILGGLMLGMVGVITLAENKGHTALRQAQGAGWGRSEVRPWSDPDSDFATPKGGVNTRGN